MSRWRPSPYPEPDRTCRAIILHKDEHGVVDIGWSDGQMSDGRIFWAEMWAQDSVSMLTFFFSVKDIEDLQGNQIRDLVVKEGLVAFDAQQTASCESLQITDCAGNLMWSVNIVVGDEDRTFLTASVPIFGYKRT